MNYMTTHYLPSTIAKMLILFLLIAFTHPTLAVEYHALLVGVSHYNNPSIQSLKGPKNDVTLMQKVLLGKGFDKKKIKILADGVSINLPTRKNILLALNVLTTTVAKEDFVYIYFAGHGSQQPVTKDSLRTEPDGRDEIFLPRDTGRWQDDVELVKNAIVDDDISKYLNKLRQKGAFVWAVFDSCHSGTMTRAPLPIVKNVRDRYVDPVKVLGIPSEKFTANQAQNHAVSRGNTTDEAALEHTEKDLTDNFVAFYAAQTIETTPEMPLPADKPKNTYGLFTYTLAQVLENYDNMSYRQAAQLILNHYAVHNISKEPTPLFEGDLDTMVFGKTSVPVIQQWRIEQDDGKLKINAGQLHQLAEESILAVVKDSVSDDILGYLKITHVDIFTSELKSVEYNEKPALALEEIPQGAYTRLVTPKISFALQVALPLEPKGEIDEKEARARQLLKSFSEGKQKTCLKTDPSRQACVKIQWVDANSTSAYLRLFLKFNKLWLLPSDAQWIELGDDKTPSIHLDKTEEELRETLIDSLRRIARVRNLLHLANLMHEGEKNDTHLKVEVDLCTREKGNNEDQSVCKSQNSALFHIAKYYQAKLPFVVTAPSKDTSIKFSLENNSRKYTDITLLYLDSQYGMQAIFPELLESGRVEPKGFIKEDEAEINVNMTSGKEYLILISVPIKSQREETRFNFLSQESIPISRRGLSELYDLLSEAVFGVNWTLNLIRGSLKQTSIQVFSWRKVLPGAVDMELEHLLKEGEQAYYASNYSVALKTWQTGLEKARENNYPRYLSNFLSKVGLAHQKLGQFQKALDSFQEELNIRGEKLHDVQGEIKSQINLGEVHLELQDDEKAYQKFEQALNIGEIKKNEKHRIASNLFKLGDVYFDRGEYKKGWEYYQQGRKILRSIND